MCNFEENVNFWSIIFFPRIIIIFILFSNFFYNFYLRKAKKEFLFFNKNHEQYFEKIVLFTDCCGSFCSSCQDGRNCTFGRKWCIHWGTHATRWPSAPRSASTHRSWCFKSKKKILLKLWETYFFFSISHVQLSRQFIYFFFK